MAEDVSIDQKTEEPTAKRIQDAEGRGNFAHSRELTSAFVLLAAILSFAMAGAFSTKHLMATWHNLFAAGSCHSAQFDGHEGVARVGDGQFVCHSKSDSICHHVRRCDRQPGADRRCAVFIASSSAAVSQNESLEWIQTHFQQDCVDGAVQVNF